MKIWWVHVEAINAMLLAHKLTGSAAHEAWFERLCAYSFDHFSDRAGGGEWYGYLERDGSPAFTLKGGKWKGFFHLPRTLMLCERWLTDMAGEDSATASDCGRMRLQGETGDGT